MANRHIHGWISRKEIDRRMGICGYTFVVCGDRDGHTDGEADLIYEKDGEEYRLRGNYWADKSFNFPTIEEKTIKERVSELEWILCQIYENRLSVLERQIASIGIRLDTLVEIESFSTLEKVKATKQRYEDLCNRTYDNGK